MEIPQTLEERIYNWLKIGFLQPSERISELFYYDKRDNQFFSILITDYFHFDDDYYVPENATSSYSKDILEVLADRLIRIDNNDKLIIPLSRTSKEENSSDDYLDRKIQTFLSSNSINIKTATIWEVDMVGSVTIDLRNNNESESQQNQKVETRKWWEFWK